MAGILDFLSSPDNALAIGLLGAANSGKGFGGGLLDAVNYANTVKQHNEDRDLQKQYRNAQIQELQRKSLADARMQSFADAWLGGQAGAGAGAGAGAAPPQGAAGGQGGMPMVDGSSPQAQSDQSVGRYAIERADGGVSAVPQRALGGNGLLSAPMPQGGAAAAPAPGGLASRLRNFTRSVGIPDEVIGMDLAMNGGKGIAELLAKASMPNWQNINNNLVNTNAPGFTGGPQAGLSISSNGQATSWVPDGRGGWSVGAPQGAIDTFTAYQRAAADNKPVKVYNPATGREEYTTEGNVVRGARSGGNVSSPGYAGGSRDSAAQEQIRMMQNELMRLPPSHPDVPVIKREIERLRGDGSAGAQSGNYAAGPSAMETAAAEAARARAVDAAKADVVRDTGRQSENKLANKLTTGVDRALELLQQGPTSSVVGNLADKGMGAFGISTKSGETAAQLEALSGWLVSNVPRMEGPQSNMDVQNYQTMAGRIGDRNLPIGTRLAAAQEVKRLQQKYSELNGGVPAEQPGPSQAAQREFGMLPKASDYDGRRMRAPDGTIYRSSGGKWVKE